MDRVHNKRNARSGEHRMRYTMKYSNHYTLGLDFYDNKEKISPKELIMKTNKLQEENEKLKKIIEQKCPLCGCDLINYYKPKIK